MSLKFECEAALNYRPVDPLFYLMIRPKGEDIKSRELPTTLASLNCIKPTLSLVHNASSTAHNS